MSEENIIEYWNTTEKEGDLKARCVFDVKTEKYTVYVSNGKSELSKSWKRIGFQPRFGMDSDDYYHSFKIAEELSEIYDKQTDDNIGLKFR